MRIVSGDFKGRKLSPPASFRARPTTDRARESLFNILNNLIDFNSQIVLDLFSGTGAISLEFASRGCRSITAVEKNYSHFSFIKNTVSSWGLNKQIQVIKADVFKVLNKMEGNYTLIFADPPFDLPTIPDLPQMVFKSQLLSENGFFILEHGPGYNFEDSPHFWQKRRYGKVNFSFFR